MLQNVTPMLPDSMVLPSHIRNEAIALRNAASLDNPVTDAIARPLVASTAVWLLRNGTINKEDSPGVIQKASELLHEYIPMHLLQVGKGKARATDFSSRIASFLQNHVTKSSGAFRLHVGYCIYDRLYCILYSYE